MVGERGGAASEQAGFAQTLGTLKQEGSNVLLVGRETADAHALICHRLLGEPEAEPRYRLFVTDDGDDVSGRNGDDISGSDRVVTRSAADECARDVATRTIDYSELELGAGSGIDEVSGRTPLGTLGIEITDAVDAFDDAADGLEPSELRVCVDSLVPLLEEHRLEKVFRLLHMTTSRVVHVNGMGHYHLPLERDHDAVNLFEPMFDAIVEVRTRDGSFEQRWELRDHEAPTEWLPFHRH